MSPKNNTNKLDKVLVKILLKIITYSDEVITLGAKVKFSSKLKQNKLGTCQIIYSNGVNFKIPWQFDQFTRTPSPLGH